MDLILANSLVNSALTAAENEAIAVSVAVVDAGGHLIALSRMDGAAFLTVDIAIGKAYTSAAFGAASGDVAAGLSSYPDFTPTLRHASHGLLTLGPGGSPVVRDGKIVGAVAVSGGTPDQDGRLAKETADATVK